MQHLLASTPSTGRAGKLGEVLPGFGIVAVMVALLAFAAVSWPQNPVARELREQPAASVAAPVAVSPESVGLTVVLVVGTEERALKLRGLQDGARLLSGSGIGVFPLEIQSVDPEYAPDIGEQDDHLRSVCAVTKCTKLLYVDLRTLPR